MVGKESNGEKQVGRYKCLLTSFSYSIMEIMDYCYMIINRDADILKVICYIPLYFSFYEVICFSCQKKKKKVRKMSRKVELKQNMRGSGHFPSTYERKITFRFPYPSTFSTNNFFFGNQIENNSKPISCICSDGTNRKARII